MKDSEYPVIKIFVIGKSVKFWCPFCKRWHIHGAGDGTPERWRIALMTRHSQTPDIYCNHIRRLSGRDVFRQVKSLAKKSVVKR